VFKKRPVEKKGIGGVEDLLEEVGSSSPQQVGGSRRRRNQKKETLWDQTPLEIVNLEERGEWKGAEKDQQPFKKLSGSGCRGRLLD